MLKRRSDVVKPAIVFGTVEKYEVMHAVGVGREMASEYVHVFLNRDEKGARRIRSITSGFELRAIAKCGRDIRLRKIALCACLFEAARVIHAINSEDANGRKDSDGVKTVWSMLIKELAILLFGLTKEARQELYRAFDHLAHAREWQKYFHGALREAMVARAAQQAGAEVYFTYTGLDVRWSVDILVSLKTQAFAVQVKPPVDGDVVHIRHAILGNSAAEDGIQRGTKELNRRHQATLIPVIVYFDIDGHGFRLESDPLEIAFSTFFSRRMM
jgi:hypothetical protein